jgi:hypothetical protein
MKGKSWKKYAMNLKASCQIQERKVMARTEGM